MRTLLIILLSLACTAACTKDEDKPDEPPVLSLPSARVRLVAGADTLQVLTELATNADQRTLGLMERRHLADTAGMLFLYPGDQPATAGFWMFRTRIPLDIGFMDSSGTIRAIKNMAPCASDLAQGCPTYDPGVPYRAALEVSAGYFTRHRVLLGATVILSDTTRLVSRAK